MEGERTIIYSGHYNLPATPIDQTKGCYIIIIIAFQSEAHT
jgi:hypothetical protein